MIPRWRVPAFGPRTTHPHLSCPPQFGTGSQGGARRHASKAAAPWFWGPGGTRSPPAAAGARLGTFAPSSSSSHLPGSGVVTGKTKAGFGRRGSLPLPSPPQSHRCLFPPPDAIAPSGLRGRRGARASLAGFPSSPRAGAWGCRRPGGGSAPTRVPRSPRWDGAGWGHSAPCPPWHARRQSHLSAESFPKQTPQRPPSFPGDPSLPHPHPP